MHPSASRPAESRTWTTIGEYTLHARTWNASEPHHRPTVVLVHGLAVSSRYMVPTARHLARDGFAVFAPDLPGFGHSEKPRRSLTVHQLADVLDAWMAAWSLRHVTLVGHSIGCQVILDLAAAQPARIAQLVLGSPTIDAAHRSVLGEIWRLLLDAPRERWPLIPLNLRDYARAGPRRALETLRYAVEDRPEHRAPAVRVPTLIVRGTRDPIVSQPWVELLAQRLPRGELALVPGAPHAMNYSRAGDFARIVASFARRHGVHHCP